MLLALLACYGFGVASSLSTACRVRIASRRPVPHARSNGVRLLESEDILEQERRLEKLEKELESELESEQDALRSMIGLPQPKTRDDSTLESGKSRKEAASPVSSAAAAVAEALQNAQHAAAEAAAAKAAELDLGSSSNDQPRRKKRSRM